ncbi:MAG: EF-hand domain-containing protein [Geminicoccaceae bacterium]|nr:hypothetical protein [Geminicoccaceae bacterium]MCB9942763.1 EF-hand domain-containing protein [Geminicoccaceae bacterium]
MRLFRLAALLPFLLVTVPVAVAQQPGQHFLDNWDLDESGDVSVDELRERRGDVFSSFDHDDNGVLDEDEYDVFDEARHSDMQNEPGRGKGMDHVMRGLERQNNDADGDGLVSREEFVGNSDAWFRSLDRNEDGIVNTDDFGRH